MSYALLSLLLLKQPSYVRLTRHRKFCASPPLRKSVLETQCKVTAENPDAAYIVCAGCNDVLCGSCRTSWHPGLTCLQYQALPESEKLSVVDRETAEALQAEGLQRCGQCKMFVELAFGCYHMTCRSDKSTLVSAPYVQLVMYHVFCTMQGVLLRVR
jgi:hypothetical protein